MKKFCIEFKRTVETGISLEVEAATQGDAEVEAANKIAKGLDGGKWELLEDYIMQTGSWETKDES